MYELWNDGINISKIEFLYEIGNVYYYKVKFKNQEFCGEYDFSFYKEDIINFLDKMQKEKSGKIDDYESEAFILILTNSNNDVFIQGQLGTTFRHNYLIFEFKSDQIFISLFEHFLKSNL